MIAAYGETTGLSMKGEQEKLFILTSAFDTYLTTSSKD